MTREKAIELVKDAMPTLWKETKVAIQTLIPELAESEDERIRKELLSFIESVQHNYLCATDKRKKWIDYLERQKEQKGIPSRETILGIWELGNLWKENPEEREGLTQLQYIQKNWFEKCDYIEEQKPTSSHIPKFKVGDIIQHVPLEKWDKSARVRAIDENGYSIDYTHIGDSVSGGYIGFSFENEYELVEQKPAEQNNATINGEPIPMENQSVDIPLPEWSEEDEKTINEILTFFRKMADGETIITDTDDAARWYAWLVDKWSELKERFKSLCSQPKQELSIEKAIQWFEDTFYFQNNSSGRGEDYEITTHDFDSLEEMYDSFRKAVGTDFIKK